MVHVTWGKNTVFNTPATTGGATTPAANTPTTSLFGAPSTPGSTGTSSLFGASSTPATPAAGTGTGTFSFSSNPVNTPTTSTSTSTPATSLFGSSTPAPATPAPSTGFGGGFFGTPAASTSTSTPATPSLFGNTTSGGGGMGLGGTTAAAFNPQQAALQAHLNATLYQESTRLESELIQLHAAYSPYQTTPQTPSTSSSSSLFGTIPPTQQQLQPTTTNNETCRFQHIFYDRMTPAQKTEKISLGITTGHYPQKPNHIPMDIWNKALSRNPDPDEFIPVLITSAQGLHSRLVTQQSKMADLDSFLSTLQSTIDQMKNLRYNIMTKLENDKRRNDALKRRLMKIMLKVDLCRGKNVALQGAEQELIQKLWGLKQNADVMEKILDGVKVDGKAFHEQLMLLEKERRDVGYSRGIGGGATAGSKQSGSMNSIQLNDDLKNDLQIFLKEKSDGIEALSQVLKKDERDLGIIKDGIRQRQASI